MKLYNRIEGDSYNALFAFCIEAKRYLFIVVALALLTLNLYIGLFLFCVSLLYLVFGAHHNSCCNCSLKGIENSLKFLGNNFEQPSWYFMISENFSRKSVRVDCAYFDRYKWSECFWPDGCAFYLTFRSVNFKRELTDRVTDLLTEQNVNFEKCEDGSIKIGRRDNDTGEILNVNLLLNCLKIVFDGSLDSSFFVQFQQPVVEQTKFQEFVEILRRGRGLSPKDHVIQPLDPQVMFSLSRKGKI